jgi:hypothetical protein
MIQMGVHSFLLAIFLKPRITGSPVNPADLSRTDGSGPTCMVALDVSMTVLSRLVPHSVAIFGTFDSFPCAALIPTLSTDSNAHKLSLHNKHDTWPEKYPARNPLLGGY